MQTNHFESDSQEGAVVAGGATVNLTPAIQLRGAGLAGDGGDGAMDIAQLGDRLGPFGEQRGHLGCASERLGERRVEADRGVRNRVLRPS
jgi:hypothetical protein